MVIKVIKNASRETVQVNQVKADTNKKKSNRNINTRVEVTL